MTVKAKTKIDQPLKSVNKDCTDEGSQKEPKDTVLEDDQDIRGTTTMPDEPYEEEQEQADSDLLLTFPESVHARLPEFLKKVISIADSEEEKDVLLLGSLVVLGAAMPNLFGLYDNMKVRPNLYLFVTAKASADKDILNWCKHLVRPVDLHLCRQNAIGLKEYAGLMKEYNSKKLKDPSLKILQKPYEQKIFIPANLSAAKMYKLLSGNNGIGLIFETEGDNLSSAFKSKRGDYPDVFHKAFHHESITCYGKADRKFIEINYLQLSTVLAGTNQQVASLIPNAENGLFSRFIFYYMNMRPQWKNVFSKVKDTGIAEHFNLLGNEYFKLYESLNESGAIEFSFTQRQKEEFHQFFSQLQGKYLPIYGMDYMATIRRLGLIAFRIAMIFNGLRMLETGDLSQKQECLDVDFYATLAMIKVLIRHSGHVFTQLQEEVKVTKKANKKEMFFEGLPEKFTRQDFVTLAKSLSFTERTANNYINDFCEKGLIEKTQFNEYLKKMD